MATVSDFALDEYHIGIYHPKHKNRWVAKFIGITPDRTIDTSEGGGAVSASSTITEADSGLTMQVVTFNRPSLSFAEVKLDRYNAVAYVAGKHEWATLSLTLEDDVTGIATAALQAQLERQQYLIGAGNGATTNLLAPGAVGREYKFAVDLEMRDGGAKNLEIWHIQGAWIQNINWGDLDYASGDAVKIEVTLRYDHAWQEVVAGKYGNALGGFTTG
jgi:hypothetical protein